MKQAHRSYKSSFAAIKIENRSTLAYVSLSSPFSKGKRNAADRIDWIPEVLLLTFIPTGSMLGRTSPSYHRKKKKEMGVNLAPERDDRPHLSFGMWVAGPG